MKRNKQYKWLLVGFIVYTIIVMAYYMQNVSKHGTFIYAADDPYIHMEIVHNIIKEGYWGMSGGEFTTASSTILWTGMLTVLSFMFGEHILLPFILNYIAGLTLLYVVYEIMKTFKFSVFYRWLGMTLVLTYSNLLLLTFVGMEHVLNASLSLYFLLVVYRVHQRDTSYGRLVWIGMLLVASRYESAFLVLAGCAFLFFSKRYKESILVGIFSLTFITIAGLWFMKNGAHFLPNTLLIKGNAPDVHNLNELLTYLKNGAYLFLITNEAWCIAVCLFFLVNRDKEINRMVGAFVLIYVIHGYLFDLFLGINATYFRYVLFYTIFNILFILYLAPYILQGILQRISFTPSIEYFVAIILCLLVVAYGVNFQRQAIPNLPHEIYTQQNQMAHFIHTYYDHKRIAANDIGMITYHNDIYLLDLWGLASQEITDAKRTHQYNTRYMDKIVKKKKVDLIMVYDKWFKQYGGIPTNWIKVADWKYQSPKLVGDKVSFYVLNQRDSSLALERMRTFQKTMPKEVNVKLYEKEERK